MGAELFHADGLADGQRNVTQLTVAFRNLPNAPKNRQSKLKFDTYLVSAVTGFGLRMPSSGTCIQKRYL